ncbi:MAG: serine/threonine-protein phosphatase [Planctomycetaceae bacterium]|nr:serine/threonine-protein phosphatase [Planctomycetaceae bacterium]
MVDETEQELDLALAAELQAALLPKACPTNWQHESAASLNRMCGTVGGDFYDFIRINEEQFAVVIGDVVGHGVRAALMMAQIMGFLRSEPQRRSRPVEVVAELNMMLVDLGNRTGSVMPCSLFYAVIDAPTGIGFFVNAGHPRPYLCSDGACVPLHLMNRNILLGVQEYQPEEDCHTFTAGERLVLYTDGLVDAINPAHEFYGDQRLFDTIRRCSECTPCRCAEVVFQDVEQFRGQARQSDDESILVLDRL